MSVRLAIVKHLPTKLANKYITHIMRKEGQGKSEIVRWYYNWRYKVDVGLYSYGGCFQPKFNIGGTVKIGNYCSIAEDVHYFGANHPIELVSSSAYFYNKSFGLDVKDVKRETLQIGNDVWIGYGSLILSGCHKIGDGAVIGAGSVVTHDVPPYAVVAGNPARIIRERFSQNEQELLQKSKWWEKAPAEIAECYDVMNDVKCFVKKIAEEK